MVNNRTNAILVVNNSQVMSEMIMMNFLQFTLKVNKSILIYRHNLVYVQVR